MALSVSPKVAVRAFTPRRMVAPRAARSDPQAKYEYLRSLPGVTEPFPNVFDPWNLAASASAKDLKRWRESELQHGRIAMLAAVGYVVQENVKDSPNFDWIGGRITGPAIFHFQQIKGGYWQPILLAIALAEAYRVAVGWATPVSGSSLYALKDDYEPGDLGFDPLNLKPKNPVAYKDMQSKELNNGRLAMIAVAGITVQELLFQREFLTIPAISRWLQHPTEMWTPSLPSVEMPSAPSLPSFQGPGGMELPSAPKFDFSAPNIDLPSPKGFQLPSTPELPKNIPTPRLPSFENIPTPRLPNMQQFELPKGGQQLAIPGVEGGPPSAPLKVPQGIPTR